MSSLAAARADGFYYPTDFDPEKHGSLNKYHGQHALRERGRKADQGILIIRFEIPFHIWCTKCKEKIAKGERFNAEKKAIGMYHTTKILQFSMRHHCGSIITIQTDPKNAEYLVIEGAKKKVEDSKTAADMEVIDLADDAEKERLAKDPLYRLEKGEQSKKRARSAAEEVADHMDESDAKHADPYQTNKALRASMRVRRHQEESLLQEHKALNLPDAVALLPASEDDAAEAKLALWAYEGSARHFQTEQVAHRQVIMAQPIFSSPAAHRLPAQTDAGPAAASRPHNRHKKITTQLLPGPQALSGQHTGVKAAETVTSRERADEPVAIASTAAGPPASNRTESLPHVSNKYHQTQASSKHPQQQQQHQLTQAGLHTSQQHLQNSKAVTVSGGAGPVVSSKQHKAAAATTVRAGSIARTHTSAQASVAAWAAGRSVSAGRARTAGDLASTATAAQTQGQPKSVSAIMGRNISTVGSQGYLQAKAEKLAKLRTLVAGQIAKESNSAF